MEALWQARLARQVDWVVSDHACCAREMKVAAEHPDDIWLARSGFGGTEYLLSGVFSEGSRRGMAPGYDADLALLDPARRFTVWTAESPSGQGYTPFEGQKLIGRVTATFLRGARGYDGARVAATSRAGNRRRSLRRSPVGRAGRPGRPFIHSYPQGFPHPQPTHILWITGSRTATHRG